LFKKTENRPFLNVLVKKKIFLIIRQCFNKNAFLQKKRLLRKKRSIPNSLYAKFLKILQAVK